jgi:putative transposase
MGRHPRSPTARARRTSQVGTRRHPARIVLGGHCGHKGVCTEVLGAARGRTCRESRTAAFRVDNDPELTAETFVEWCAGQGIVIHYIQPGKPDQNAYIERFNRSYRTEVLDAYLLESVSEVRELTDAWLVTYSHERPHDSLGRVPPLTFLPRPQSAGESPFALSP